MFYRSDLCEKGRSISYVNLNRSTPRVCRRDFNVFSTSIWNLSCWRTYCKSIWCIYSWLKGTSEYLSVLFSLFSLEKIFSAINLSWYSLHRIPSSSELWIIKWILYMDVIHTHTHTHIYIYIYRKSARTSLPRR